MRFTIELQERTLIVAAAALLLVWALLKLRRLRTSPRVCCDTTKRNLKVVVTGSSRGLGLELARHFLQLGDDVVISSRTANAVEDAAQQLRREFPERTVVAVPCDVSKHQDVQALVGKAAHELGRIDILVANAALSAKAKAPAAASSAEEQAAIVATNLGGALLCAMKEMQRQPGGGKVFLMDGAGSRGQPTPGNAAYGACKRGLVQLRASLAAEAREANKAAAAGGSGGQVSVHLCSPGMVATDLLLRYATNPRSAKFINILAEEPSTVAAWLVPRMRGVTGQGAYFKFLTPAGAAWRFLTARRRRRRFVPEGGSTPEGYQQLPAGEPGNSAPATVARPADD